jgi:hypothetical protein
MLAILGTLALLAFTLLAAAWIYWLSLIRNFTSDKPTQLPRSVATEERYAELKERWEGYARLFVDRREPIPPFELSADEINVFAARLGPLRDQAFVEIRPPHLRIQFSAPLDRSGNPRLQGRFLNGIATLLPTYVDHQIHLRIVSLDANGKPIPGWILRRLQQTNWGDALNRRPEFDLAFRALERVELGTDRLLLHPALP